MNKNDDFGSDFLTEQGRGLLKSLKEHCAKLNMYEIDSFELAMLANSFTMYSSAAKICRDDGVAMTIITEKGSEYSQIRPEYTVMKTEYQNILKHSAKFGLNPADRERIFKGLKKEEEKPKGVARFTTLRAS